MVLLFYKHGFWVDQIFHYCLHVKFDKITVVK